MSQRLSSSTTDVAFNLRFQTSLTSSSKVIRYSYADIAEGGVRLGREIWMRERAHCSQPSSRDRLVHYTEAVSSSPDTYERINTCYCHSSYVRSEREGD